MPASGLRLGRAILVFLPILLLSDPGSGSPTAENLMEPRIIPKPSQMEVIGGGFSLSSTTKILVESGSPELTALGDYLVARLSKSTGYNLAVSGTEVREVSGGNILLTTAGADGSLGEEGYELTASAAGARITAPNATGVFYGIQTLRQLLPNAVELDMKVLDMDWRIPGVRIADSPAYGWRGLLLDSGRRFMSVDFVKRYIDLLAYHKMNVLHLHLTEDQGWRIEIKRYPKLTEVGAWSGTGENRYGGFYSQTEVREIVAYAESRRVLVVPEIEMPGHSTAAIASYPELSCHGNRVPVADSWGIKKDIYCAGKEETFEFLENVLTEVIDLFPSPYIHIGGDEAPKDNWEKCELCQARIKTEGLADAHELQGYFTRRIEKFLTSKGRRLIGWDEILEGGLGPRSIVQSWRGFEGAVTAARMGHQVISSPTQFAYFDYPQDTRRSKPDWMELTSIRKAYDFDPTPEEFSAEEAGYIMGGECTMWTEHAPQPEVDQQLFPRLCAFSETVWTPKADRDYKDFQGRLAVHLERLDALGVEHYRPEVRIGGWRPQIISVISKPIDWEIDQWVKGPGHYRVTLNHESGSNRINIESVALLVDGEEVDRDVHDGYSGSRQYEQVYRVRLEEYIPGAEYTIRARFYGEGGTASRGSVWIKYFSFK